MVDKFVPAVIVVVAILLQVIVAPVITVFSAVPSFLASLVVVYAILRQPDTVYWYAFGLGLVADLLSSTPLGLTSALLLVACFVAGRAFQVMDKSVATMPIIAIFVTMFVIEFVKLVVLIVIGYQGSPIELFFQSALPGAVANGVLGVVWYFVCGKFGVAQEASADAWSSTISNTRFR